MNHPRPRERGHPGRTARTGHLAVPRQSDTDPGPPLATPRSEDGPPGAGPHAQPEAVGLRAVAVIRLKRTLAHGDSRYTGPGRHDGAHTIRGAACARDSTRAGSAPYRFRTCISRPRAGGRPVNATRNAAAGQAGPGLLTSPRPDRQGSQRHLRNTSRLRSRHRNRPLGYPQRFPGAGIRDRTVAELRRSRRPQGSESHHGARAHPVEKPVDHMWGREVNGQ
jgi:hypothetical protein